MSAPRRVYFSVEEIEVPGDLHDGEIVEAIRLGGPRDGATIGLYRVTSDGEEGWTLHGPLPEEDAVAEEQS